MTAKIQCLEWPKCPKCGHSDIRVQGFDHADVCEYLTFRDVTAAQIGWALISGGESRYIKVVFDIHGIEHRVFSVSGVGGRYMEVYAPDHIATMIKMYYSDKSPYGGMDLSEYLDAVMCTEVTAAT